MAETETKLEYPTGADLYQPHRDIEKLARSATVIVPVANRAEADAIASTYNPSPDRPLYVDRADTGALERNRGNGWRLIPEEDPWRKLELWAAYPWVGHGQEPRIRTVGTRIETQGRYKRQSDTDFGTSSAGYGVVSIPEEFRPLSTIRVPVTTTGPAGSIPYAHGELTASNGELRVWCNGNTPWIEIDTWWSKV